jgi:hypothetical protein
VHTHQSMSTWENGWVQVKLGPIVRKLLANSQPGNPGA